MTASLVVTAFLLATLLAQRVLGGRKIQEGMGGVAGAHLAVAVPAFAALHFGLHAGLAAPAVFWAGAALCWFVVRSHLESSILLAMLEDVEAGRGECSGLLRGHGAGGFAARLEGLREAGLVDARGVTRRGRLVLAGFALLGGRGKR